MTLGSPAVRLWLIRPSAARRGPLPTLMHSLRWIQIDLIITQRRILCEAHDCIMNEPMLILYDVEFSTLRMSFIFVWLPSFPQTGPNSLVQVPGPPTTTGYVAPTTAQPLAASAGLASSVPAPPQLPTAPLPAAPQLASTAPLATAPLAPQLVPQQPVFAAAAPAPAPAPAPQQVVLQGQQVLTSMGGLGGGFTGQLGGQALGGHQLVTLPTGQQAIVRAQPQVLQLAPQPVQQQFMQVLFLFWRIFLSTISFPDASSCNWP